MRGGNKRKGSQADSETIVTVTSSTVTSSSRRGDEQSSQRSSQQQVSSKRVKFRQIAERRAAHFARADPVSIHESVSVESARILSKPSSTPTGIRPVIASTADTSDDKWCGPFATAYEIIGKREEAKRLREELMKQHDNDSLVYDEDLDEYDTTIRQILTAQSYSTASNQSLNVYSQKVKRLVDICLTVVTDNFDNLSSTEGLEVMSVDMISNDLKIRIAEMLAEKHLLTADRIQAMMVSTYFSNDWDGVEEIVLPDCSQINEDELIQLIERASKSSTSLLVGIDRTHSLDNDVELYQELSGSSLLLLSSSEQTDRSTSAIPLKVVRLKYCGNCFTDKTAAVCVNLFINLEILELIGTYRLTDTALTKLISCCADSLRVLDLSYNNRLGRLALTQFGNGKLQALTSLSLNYIPQLVDSDISTLLLSPDESSWCNGVLTLPNLESLSLAGCQQLSDVSLCPVLTAYGNQLKHLSIQGCPLLTDATITALRTFCSQMFSLDCSDLPNVSTAAWIGLFVSDPVALTVSESTSSSTTTRIRKNATLGPLEEIRLSQNPNLTDDVIIQLAITARNNLRLLDVNGCNLITNRSIVALQKYCCQSLQNLDVSFIRKFNDIILLSLIRKCSTLTSLSVWGCTQLSAEFYYAIQDFLASTLTVHGKITR